MRTQMEVEDENTRAAEARIKVGLSGREGEIEVKYSETTDEEAKTKNVWCKLLFFFSSRRRHTRYWRDWSSDVCSSDLGSRLERLHQRAGDQVPAVDQDEQEDLERQRDEDRRQHHHAHAHQRRGDDEVDDEERQEDEEADLKRRLELADDERGHEHVGRDVRARLRPLELGYAGEQRDVLLARLAEHELAHRALRALERLHLRYAALLQRIPGLLLD